MYSNLDDLKFGGGRHHGTCSIYIYIHIKSAFVIVNHRIFTTNWCLPAGFHPTLEVKWLWFHDFLWFAPLDHRTHGKVTVETWKNLANLDVSHESEESIARNFRCHSGRLSYFLRKVWSHNIRDCCRVCSPLCSCLKSQSLSDTRPRPFPKTLLQWFILQLVFDTIEGVGSYEKISLDWYPLVNFDDSQ